MPLIFPPCLSGICCSNLCPSAAKHILNMDFLSFEILRDQYPLVLAPVTALFLEINTSGLMHLRHLGKRPKMLCCLAHWDSTMSGPDHINNVRQTNRNFIVLLWLCRFGECPAWMLCYSHTGCDMMEKLHTSQVAHYKNLLIGVRFDVYKMIMS